MNKKIDIFRITFLLMILSCSFYPRLLTAEDFGEKHLNIRPVSYSLDFQIDYDEGRLSCEGEMTVTNSADEPADDIPLLLYRLFKLESLTDENGKALPFQSRIVAFSDWEKLQVKFIQIPLNHPLEKDERITFRFKYSGYLAGYTEAMRYVKDHISREYTVLRNETNAFPIIGYPSWKVNRAAGLPTFAYQIHVTVPDDLVVANGGKLINKTVGNGLATYTYRNLKPAWRIDAAIAPYEVLDAGKNKIYHFPKDSSGARRAMGTLEKTLNLFTKWFGPLNDYQGFSIIEIPDGYGSQADVTAILQEAKAFQKQGSLTGLYHEISHKWNVDSIDPLPPRFESEGLAMFLQHLLEEHFENKSGAVEKAFTKYTDRLCRMAEKKPEYKDIPMIDHGKADITDLSYTKGMLMFAILYELVGQETFNKMMGSFYHKYLEPKATADEFVVHCKSISNIDLGRFFDDWVYGTRSWMLICDRLTLEEMAAKYR